MDIADCGADRVHYAGRLETEHGARRYRERVFQVAGLIARSVGPTPAKRTATRIWAGPGSPTSISPRLRTSGGP